MAVGAVEPMTAAMAVDPMAVAPMAVAPMAARARGAMARGAMVLGMMGAGVKRPDRTIVQAEIPTVGLVAAPLRP